MLASSTVQYVLQEVWDYTEPFKALFLILIEALMPYTQSHIDSHVYHRGSTMGWRTWSSVTLAPSWHGPMDTVILIWSALTWRHVKSGQVGLFSWHLPAKVYLGPCRLLMRIELCLGIHCWGPYRLAQLAYTCPHLLGLHSGRLTVVCMLIVSIRSSPHVYSTCHRSSPFVSELWFQSTICETLNALESLRIQVSNWPCLSGQWLATIRCVPTMPSLHSLLQTHLLWCCDCAA